MVYDAIKIVTSFQNWFAVILSDVSNPIYFGSIFEYLSRNTYRLERSLHSYNCLGEITNILGWTGLTEFQHLDTMGLEYLNQNVKKRQLMVD